MEHRTESFDIQEKAGDEAVLGKNETVALDNDKTSLDVGSVERKLSEHTIELPKSRGVRRMENVKLLMTDAKHGKVIKVLFSVSLLICAWTYALDSSTTYNYQVVAASSFDRHSMISTVGIATSIISSVCQPFIAKLSDMTSRPNTFIFLLVIYTIGYIVVASSSNITAYIVGEVFNAIGSSGVAFLYGVIASDLTPLKYRGLAQAALGSPYIINTWFSGLIVNDVLASNWRWGYGMFAIIMPVVLTPAIIIMIYYESKAQKFEMADQGLVSVKKSWYAVLKQAVLEIDAFGLLLMGFGWSLLLIPFSIYSTAENQWKNPSIIAMFIVGGILLIIYAVYESLWAPFPSMPKRVLLNRTFMTAVGIDFMYYFAGYFRILYLSSYVWIVKNWSNQNWTYFNNTLTMALTLFAILAGLLHRITHRYKAVQIVGLAIQILGAGILVRPVGTVQNTGTLVMSQTLCGLGGSFSVVGTQVASQASVPHQDLALAIALLNLYTSIGGAIASAIASAIWTTKMPKNLRKYVPAYVNDTQVATYFADLTSIRALPYDGEVRQGIIHAYTATSWYLFVPAVCLSVIPFLIAFCQKNFYLGDSQNAIEVSGDPEKAPTQELDGNEVPMWKKKLRQYF